jgi:hypothetical protein
VSEGSEGAAELEPGTHSRKRDMNSEMCRSNVSVLEVRIAAKGVHARSNVAIFGRSTPISAFCRRRREGESGPRSDEPFR